MQYRGKYKILDASKIRTYSLSTRSNKVKREDLIFPKQVLEQQYDVSLAAKQNIDKIARAIISSREKSRPVIFFSGAHLMKNGLGPLVIDLIIRDLITLFAGNAATAIHDFELALIGETSENVPKALGQGEFGMSYEFSYINTALSLGNKYCLGYGEALGKMICEEDFRNEVLTTVGCDDSPKDFLYPELSVLKICYEKNIPFTVHAGIGMDVIDQHASFDGEAKGGCSGRDFLIYAHEATKFEQGGCILNIGSAVHGPEVLLKAFSMAANIGKTPHNIVTADFDLRPFDRNNMVDEASEGYYFRDQKSIVTRVPDAFGGKGFYIQGNQIQTIPFLYKQLIALLN